MKMVNILSILKYADISTLNTLGTDELTSLYTAANFLIKTRVTDIDILNITKVRDYIRDNNLLQEKSFNMEPSIKLDIDGDGNLLITKRDGLNYNSIFHNSHTLLKAYEKVNNIDGMKYELCKLYMIVTIINEKYIHSTSLFTSKEKRQQMIQLKSFIMGDFHKYLNIILKNDTEFNFNEYFSNTKFGIESYKINNTVLKGIKQIIF